MKLNDLPKQLQYLTPNAEREFDESQRYESLRGMSVKQWCDFVRSGRAMSITPQMLTSIGNSTATSPEVARETLGDLEPEKQERALMALASGRVEYPIVLRDGNSLDLLAGNTRLTAIVAKGLTPKVWVVDVTSINRSN